MRDALPGLAEALGDGAKFTIVFNQAPFIEQSIESLAQEGLLGLLFAVIVIFVFLISLRSTIVTAVSIPVSVLLTFIGMLAFGYSLNVLTLGALTIAIGRVVDDSIVVIENIKRHLGLGENKLDAIKSGVREVAVAVTASTITTVAVFLPLALVTDITGELFRPFALTITIALAASLFVALTIVPVLAYWFLRSPITEAPEPLTPGEQRIARAVSVGRSCATRSCCSLIELVLLVGAAGGRLVPHARRRRRRRRRPTRRRSPTRSASRRSIGLGVLALARGRDRGRGHPAARSRVAGRRAPALGSAGLGGARRCAAPTPRTSSTDRRGCSARTCRSSAGRCVRPRSCSSSPC